MVQGIRSKSVFCEGSVMCFIETWKRDNVPDTIGSLAGFQLVWAEKSCNEIGKEKLGETLDTLQLKTACAAWITARIKSLSILIAQSIFPGHYVCCLHPSLGKCIAGC